MCAVLQSVGMEPCCAEAWNAHSIINKAALIIDLITSASLDALAICESWITNDDPAAIQLDCVPAGYKILHLPQHSATTKSCGGGLCLIHRAGMTVKPHTLQQSLTPSTFECQLLSVQIGKHQPIAFANIYRPHRTTSTDQSSTVSSQSFLHHSGTSSIMADLLHVVTSTALTLPLQSVPNFSSCSTYMVYNNINVKNCSLYKPLTATCIE